MRILAFPGRLNTKAKAPVRDWSQQEIADFYRAHRLLAENGAGIGIDRGVSDEGEPWMVFFDTASHDVFLHIARIDNLCHLVCEPFNMRLDAADITSLIAQFEHAVRDYLAIRSERAKNVVIHPAARIIMSISAVFLLFKLENGEAYAKGPADKAGALGPDARAGEKSAGPLARAQSAFQRAFDAADAPVNAALLAGIILAGELALSPLRTGASEAEMEKLVALALVEHEPVLVKADGAGIEAVVADAIHHVPLPVTVELPLAALEIPVPELADMPVTVLFTPAETVVQLAALGPEPADFRTAQFIPVAVEAPARAPAEKLVLSEAKADAAKLLELLFTSTVAIGLQPGVVIEGGGKKPVKITDISLDKMDRLADQSGDMGFVQQTFLDFGALYKLIGHFTENMDTYSFQYRSDGRVLIEEKGVGLLDASDVGMITNHTSSGGTYIIIGRADLLDDVLTFFL